MKQEAGIKSGQHGGPAEGNMWNERTTDSIVGVDESQRGMAPQTIPPLRCTSGLRRKRLTMDELVAHQDGAVLTKGGLASPEVQRRKAQKACGL